MLKFRKTCYLIAVGFVLMGTIICVQGVQVLLGEYRLESRGLRTLGEVESRYTRDYYSSARSRMVEETWIIIGYWVDGKWHGNRFKLPRRFEQDFEKGQMVEVAYDPDNPSNGRPLKLKQAGVGRIKAIIGYLMLFGGFQSFLVLALKPGPSLPEYWRARQV